MSANKKALRSIIFCPDCGKDRKDSFMHGDSWWCGHCGAASISPADRDRYAKRLPLPSTPGETSGDNATRTNRQG